MSPKEAKLNGIDLATLEQFTQLGLDLSRRRSRTWQRALRRVQVVRLATEGYLDKKTWRKKRKGRYAWYADRDIKVGNRHITVQMHAFVVGMPPVGYETDHIDTNGLNNTRENLRFVTRSQNMMNRTKALGTSTKYKGVSFHKHNKRYIAYINANFVRHFLGCFDTAELAAIAYNEAAKIYFGEYARLNVIL